MDTLVEVCKQLPEIPFVFAGTGPLAEQLEGMENVKNVGFQTGEALHQLIAQARFTVYPSQWYENCPFSVMESQMYGTPVLGADIGGIPELITDGVTGELFESGNANQLKEKILSLWHDRQRLTQYTDACRNVRFASVEQYCEKLMAYYNPD